MKINRNALNDKVRDRLRHFLKSRFRVFGQDYYTLEVQRDEVILVAAAPRRPGHPISADRPDEKGWIFWLLNYLSPLAHRGDQTLGSWRACFKRYFSETIPGYRLPLHCVGQEADIGEDDYRDREAG